MASRTAWRWLFWWPVRRTEQMLFAEALSQTLVAGIDIDAGLLFAADIIPSRRFRAALYEMARGCGTGYPLDISLVKTGIAVGGELVSAIRVGEERGCLSEQLAAFARRCDREPSANLAAALGRRVEVTRFASALADLLVDHGMTIGLIEDAGRLAAGEKSKFMRIIARVIESMKGGRPFAEALREESTTFDLFLCRLIAATRGRDQLRTVLARISGDAIRV